MTTQSAGTLIEFHDPRAQPETEPDSYDLTVSLDKPMAIGLVANGFPDSVRFLDHVEKALAQAIPNATFHRYDKGDASSIVGDQMLADIKDECQAVVAAFGH
jgi:hypothetical protein